MTNQFWKSVHIYYYDPNKDDFLVNCVEPLFKAVNARTFFVRHWIQGPHLRLRFECESDKHFEDEIKPLIEQYIGQYLQQTPSHHILDIKTLLPIHKKLAVLEKENGPIWPFYPDNSIQYLPYDQRLHVLGNTTMTALIEDFYIATNALTFEMLKYVREGYSLHQLCFDLMVTLAHVTGQGITHGYASYRSHSEGFFMFCSNPQATRELFERRYAQHASSFTERLPQIIDALDQNNASAFPFIYTFAQVLRNFQQRGLPLIRSGEIDMMYMANQATEEDKSQFQTRLTHSAFHSIAEANPGAKDALYADPVFQCYRLMLNLLYLHFNRLGIVSIERFQLCYFTANTVERVYNINILERMRKAFQPVA